MVRPYRDEKDEVDEQSCYCPTPVHWQGSLHTVNTPTCEDEDSLVDEGRLPCVCNFQVLSRISKTNISEDIAMIYNNDAQPEASSEVLVSKDLPDKIRYNRCTNLESSMPVFQTDNLKSTHQQQTGPENFTDDDILEIPIFIPITDIDDDESEIIYLDTIDGTDHQSNTSCSETDNLKIFSEESADNDITEIPVNISMPKINDDKPEKRTIYVAGDKNQESIVSSSQTHNLKPSGEQQHEIEDFDDDDILDIPIYISMSDIDDDDFQHCSSDVADSNYHDSVLSRTETGNSQMTSEQQYKTEDSANDDIVENFVDIPTPKINVDKPKELKIYVAAKNDQESIVSSSQIHNLKPSGEQQPEIEDFADDDILDIPIYISMSDIDDDEFQHWSSDVVDSTDHETILSSTETYNLQTTSEQEIANSADDDVKDIPMTEINDDNKPEKLKRYEAVNNEKESLVSISQTRNLKPSGEQQPQLEDFADDDILDIPIYISMSEIDDDEFQRCSSDVIDSNDHDNILLRTETDNSLTTSEQQYKTEDSANDDILEIFIDTPMPKINEDKPEELKIYVAATNDQESIVSSSQIHNLKPSGKQQSEIEDFADEDILDIPIYISMSDIDDDEFQHWSSDVVDSTDHETFLSSTETYNLQTTSEQEIANSADDDVLDIPMTEINDDNKPEKLKRYEAVNNEKESLVSISQTRNLKPSGEQQPQLENFADDDILDIPIYISMSEIDDDEFQRCSSDVIDSNDHDNILLRTETDNSLTNSEQQYKTEDSAIDDILEMFIDTPMPKINEDKPEELKIYVAAKNDQESIGSSSQIHNLKPSGKQQSEIEDFADEDILDIPIYISMSDIDDDEFQHWSSDVVDSTDHETILSSTETDNLQMTSEQEQEIANSAADDVIDIPMTEINDDDKPEKLKRYEAVYNEKESLVSSSQTHNLIQRGEQQPELEDFADDDILDIPIYISMSDIDDDEFQRCSSDVVDSNDHDGILSRTETDNSLTTSEQQYNTEDSANDDILEIFIDIPMPKINVDKPEELKIYVAAKKDQESIVLSFQIHNLKPSGKQQPGIEDFVDDDIIDIPIQIPMADIDDDEFQNCSSDVVDSSDHETIVSSTKTDNLRTTSEQRQKTEDSANDDVIEIPICTTSTDSSDNEYEEFSPNEAVALSRESISSSTNKRYKVCETKTKSSKRKRYKTCYGNKKMRSS